jgi:alanine-alpha-ketoisovalerate/valine-pyruvate aminotransferase
VQGYDSSFDPNNGIDNAVDDIITQLSTQNHSVTKNKQSAEVPDVNELEEYLVKTTARLIDTTLDAVDNVKDYISSAPENRDVASLAELMRSANSAIETMQKIHANKESIQARKDVKQMDIDAKKELNIMDNTTKLVMSREEVLKALTDGEDEEVIDI